MTIQNVYTREDIAREVGIHPAVVRNWSRGKNGLAIRPSIREGRQHGRLNLYSTSDLQLFQAVKQLRDLGFTTGSIADRLAVLPISSLQELIRRIKEIDLASSEMMTA